MNDSEKPEEEVQAIAGEQLAHALGWDTTRVWSNNVQLFRNPDHTLFVFRELTELEGVKDDGSKEKAAFAKNVASVVMPNSVADAFADIMKRIFIDARETES